MIHSTKIIMDVKNIHFLFMSRYLLRRFCLNPSHSRFCIHITQSLCHQEKISNVARLGSCEITSSCYGDVLNFPKLKYLRFMWKSRAPSFVYFCYDHVRE